jgi:hypothetical protein
MNTQDEQSRVGLFEIVQQVENLVRRRSELPDDLAIIRTLLALERTPRLVDVPEVLRHLLTLRVGDPKDPIGSRQFRFVASPSRVTVSMSFSAGLRHS